MKRIVLILILALFCTTVAFSDWYFGGNLFINAFSLDEEMEFEVSPTFGFVINNKLDWGFNLLYGKGKDPYNYNYDYYNYGLGAFFRYSFFQIDNFKVLGRFGLDCNYYDYDFDYYFSIGLSFSPILQYELFNKFFLYTSLGLINISYYYDEGWWGEDYFNYYVNLFTSGITLDSLSFGFLFLFDTSGNRFNDPQPRGGSVARSNTVMDSDDLTIGVSANPGGFIFARPSICIELNKGNFYSDINIIIPSGGFGLLGTFNYFWHNHLGGFYLGGGLGYYLSVVNNSAWNNFTLGANLGFKFLFSSGIFLRTGGLVGMALRSNENDSEMNFYFNPNISLGYSF